MPATQNKISEQSNTACMLEALPMAIGVCTVDRFQILHVNQNLADLVDVRAEELIGKPAPGFLSRTTDGFRLYQQLQKDGQVDNLTIRATLPGQRRQTFSVSAAPYLWNTEPSWLISLFDITQLAESTHVLGLFQKLVNSTQELMAFIGRDYHYQLVNRAFTTKLGYPQESLIGQHASKVVGDSFFTNKAKPALDRCFEGEQIEVFSWIDYENAGTRYMRISYSPHRTKSGEIIGAVICANDLTEWAHTRRALEESEQKYRQIFNLESDVIVVFDGETLAPIDFNHAALTTYRYSREEFSSLIAPQLAAVPEHAIAFLKDQVCDSPARQFERVHKRSDGSEFTVEGNLTCFQVGDKKVYCYVGRDISERKRVEKDLQETNKRFRAIVEALPLPMIISRLEDGCIVYANDLAEQQLPSEHSIVGADVKDIFTNEKQRIAILDAMRADGRATDIQISIRSQERKKRWLSCTASLITFLGEECVATGFIDVTETRELSRQLKYQASHDPLTGLINRREFEVRLKRAVASAKADNVQHALCYLDLDQFKLVNDSRGHEAGDSLLRKLSRKLRECLRRRDTLARLGGDEFAVIIEYCSLDQALLIAEKLRKTIETLEFSWYRQRFEIGVSIGLVAITTTTDDASDILKTADRACYMAKKTGRNRVHAISRDGEDMQRHQDELSWISRVKHAIREDRFCLYWQLAEPPVTGNTTLLYNEILIRMIDDNGDHIEPESFLPIAERFGLAPQVDRWVVDTAMTCLLAHQHLLDDDTIWAINLSGHSISDEVFRSYLLDKLSESVIPIQQICFEVTETTAVNNISEAGDFLHALRDSGCKVALDDFGSGHASYAYLKHLPVDFLKIDGQFIRDIATDKFDREIVNSINDIAHVANILTIAEHVDSKAQIETLKEIGVDYCQGHAVNKPAALTLLSEQQKKAR